MRPVLLVEDDARLRAYLEGLLAAYGRPVIATESGEEALRLLAGAHPALAVLDIGLPGMDGFALAEHLPAEVPVLVVTGDPLKAKLRSFGRTARFTVLAKPITPDRFESAVQALL